MWGERVKWRPVLWRHRLQTHAAHTPSIHLSLTRCCESTDNLLYSPLAAHIAPSATSLPSSHRATLKDWFNTLVESIQADSFGFIGSDFEISVSDISASIPTQQGWVDSVMLTSREAPICRISISAQQSKSGISCLSDPHYIVSFKAASNDYFNYW